MEAGWRGGKGGGRGRGKVTKEGRKDGTELWMEEGEMEEKTKFNSVEEKDKERRIVNGYSGWWESEG